nr:Chain D, Giant hemoglobin, B1(d) globin chain [Oligobrachia mashikoi]2D2N_D Chain D, Giant hemoglobin, B1(d) globin chain [Oligobrachia mashikoi]
ECCSRGDAEVVISEWDQVFNAAMAGSSESAVGVAIFDAFFASSGVSPSMFPGGGDSNNPEFLAQVSRVVSGADIAINSLTNRATCDSLLSHLNAQHRAISGVTGAAVTHLSQAISSVVAQVLPSAHIDAWEYCMAYIAAGIGAGL